VTAVVVVSVGVEQGIILAIVLSVILHVQRHYAPRDYVMRWDAAGRLTPSPPTPGTVTEPGLVIYRFGVGLFYANASRFAEEILGLVQGPTPPRWFVLDVDAMDDIDYTGGKTLSEVVDELSKRGIVVAVADAEAHIRSELDAFGITAQIGAERIYDSLQAARDAFHAAETGGEHAVSTEAGVSPQDQTGR
jgi:MFS superfamily sulfate permease-like transporter